ncbi:site-specific integrase [Acrocarpospora sp. B8E8]|uniref:site-specific integrase n=1 Tax=Acrocarpospora sp. B8E8 TaxID=3153572 RepID=UPI00325E6136
MTRLAPILQSFFTDKLITQKHASPHTIAAYRDALRLLLTYAQSSTGTPPWRLDLHQLDHELLTGFLRYLEIERGNSPRTRNARLATIHSLFRYAALRAPRRFGDYPAGTGHRGQPDRHHRHLLAVRHRSRGDPFRLRPQHLDRAA